MKSSYYECHAELVSASPKNIGIGSCSWTTTKAGRFRTKFGMTMVFLFVIFTKLHSQLSVSNILEYQLGNLPYTKPENLTTIYDQLSLSYRYNYITTYIRLEQFQTQNKEKSYAEFSQRSLRFSDDNLDITIGNFYEIIGRGLLLRSYELPGNILEDIGFRTRYGFYRDIDGFLLKYKSDIVELKFLRGKPLINYLPPILDNNDRRPNLVEGAEANFVFINNFNFGGAYLRNNVNDGFSEYGSIMFSGNLPFDIQVYSEYAQQFGNNNKLFSFSDKSVHGFYASINYVLGSFGLTTEIKDYKNFFLEFNDPPPLIREHSYVTLNRRTHLLNPRNETGLQIEAFFRINNEHIFTFNITQAQNKFAKKFLFQEFFSELQYVLNENVSLKGFFDFGNEPLKLEKNRYTGGLYLESELYKHWGLTTGLEYQTFNREVKPIEKVQNYVLTIALSQAPKFSGGITFERSTDPNQTDNPNTLEIETNARNWLGYTIGYQYNNKHFINLFYGKRRGGPACTSGVCYEVLDFEGLELRVSSKF